MLLFSPLFVIIHGDGFIHIKIEIDHMKLLTKMKKHIKIVYLKMNDLNILLR
jgi:hypothetical protein